MLSTKRLLGIFAFVLLCMVFINPAGAIEPIFVVNTTADTVDVNLGDGFCVDDTGKCSLRAAIMEANARPGSDIIELPAGTYTLTRTSTHEDEAVDGDLDIIPSGLMLQENVHLENGCTGYNSLRIQGAGAGVTIIDGGRIDRVFHILPQEGYCSEVTLNDLTIQHGYRDGTYCRGDDDDDDDDDGDDGPPPPCPSPPSTAGGPRTQGRCR